MHLAYAEYDDLSVLERIAILRGLSALALSADAVREYISARLEAMPAPAPPRLKKVCAPRVPAHQQYVLSRPWTQESEPVYFLVSCNTEGSYIQEGMS